ncbi:MAG: cysteine--tRNA ligase, partial [Thermosphaera sp.]|nr:cysteine--tRNA ligase [Thermosphaera sp.]
DKYEDYGRLSGRLDKEYWSQEAEFLGEKKKPYDFALWKAAKPGEPYWESPWGRGRPGWHIECSVMSSRYLGGRFDIHGGGTDLIFPHHENERAQSEAFFGVKPWVSIWMHTGMLTVGVDKMSKSLKNIVPLRDALKKYQPGVLRLWYLHVHYRKPLNYTEESIEQAEKLYNRLVSAHDLLLKLQREMQNPHYLNNEDLKILNELKQVYVDFHSALSEDFNTPEALAAVNKLLGIVYRDIQYNPKYMLVSQALRILRTANYVFGAFEEKPVYTEAGEELEKILGLLIEVRKELRKRGMYDIADTIRSELLKHGIQLMDRGIETTWIRVKKQ